MKSRWFSIAILAAALGWAQSGGNDLFQQALRKERSEGNYKAAIEIYRRILKQYASDRKLAAKALLEMAHCQEREGSKEARSSYERLIRDYSDQPQAVIEARARITALEVPASSAPRVRQLWAGNNVDDEGSISPDGRWLTYAHWETGDLGVRDLLNGTNKMLTNTGGWAKSGGEFAEDSRFSPDGKRIAYNFFIPKEGSAYELRLMNADGTGVRTLGWSNTAGYVAPLAWSPDGAQIVAAYYGPDGLTSLHLVNVASGERRELVPPGRPNTTGASFSPDGKWIVMDGPGAENWFESDLYIVPAAGGKAEKLEANPANDIQPFWSQDGKSVLFASNRGGSYGLWRLSVRNGKAEGPAHLIRGDLGNRVRLIGFNRAGSLVYSLGIGSSNVYTVDFDPAAGKAASEPKIISQRYPGNSNDPQPSPDGRLLAFFAQTGSHSGDVVVVKERATGKERVFPVSANHLIWTPDSKKLLIEARGQRRNGRELLWLDPNTGSTTPFRIVEPTRNGLFPVFSPDGRTMYFTFRHWPGSDWQVMAMDVASGAQRELYKTNRTLTGLSLSPDGRTLATIRQVSAPVVLEDDYELVLVPAAGGAVRTAAKIQRSSRAAVGSFTPDGKRVLISRRHGTGPDQRIEILSVDLGSGKLNPVGLEQSAMRFWTLDPSGKHLLFSAGAPQTEIWIAENILPAK